jgi:hypothetical protein
MAGGHSSDRLIGSRHFSANRKVIHQGYCYTIATPLLYKRAINVPCKIRPCQTGESPKISVSFVMTGLLGNAHAPKNARNAQ